jgi:predicted MPP superfamily phosphohydrolase
MSDAIDRQLERRLGRTHARQRIGIEDEHEQHVFGHGINFFHPENWYAAHSLIATVLRATGLYRIGYRNTLQFEIRHNRVPIRDLPPAFDGFTLLHMTDLHADLNPPAMQALAECIKPLRYDACVLTGDYRAQTYGPIGEAVGAMAVLLEHVYAPVYAVLGNHDSVRMLPAFEELGVRMLLNECASLMRGGQVIGIVGVDDPHYYRVDSIASASASLPADGVSILLSHTPEIYRQAAHAGFDLMLCGHTHGGQICLPGGVPLTLDSACPRRFGAGAWRHGDMQGYTSVGAGTCIVPVRLNCPPEVVLHELVAA